MFFSVVLKQFFFILVGRGGGCSLKIGLYRPSYRPAYIYMYIKLAFYLRSGCSTGINQHSTVTLAKLFIEKLKAYMSDVVGYIFD